MGKNKKILFLMYQLNIGGAETALLGLLNAIDYTKLDVDLFVYNHEGELMRQIPKEVNLLPEISVYSAGCVPIKDCLLKGYFGLSFGRIAAKIVLRFMRKIFRRDIDSIQYSSILTNPWLPKINPEVLYDVAISFLPPNRINATKVKAETRIGWIHADYSKECKDWNADLKDWLYVDKIVSISDDVTKTFTSVYPCLSDRIVKIENMMSPKMVRQRADEINKEEVISEMRLNNESINLLSVGRFSEAKNFDNVPTICQLLVEKGSDVRWYIIGYGPDEQLIRDRISENKMESKVIILGKKNNPYPYMKMCDIYVQPSRHEGNSVTVREAQMLFKPVVVTNYPTAASQIKDGIDGVIVPLDNADCADGIASLIDDVDKRIRIIEYLKSHDYGNESSINKFYELVNC